VVDKFWIFFAIFDFICIELLPASCRWLYLYWWQKHFDKTRKGLGSLYTDYLFLVAVKVILCSTYWEEEEYVYRI
jgi:hypothetical protein